MTTIVSSSIDSAEPQVDGSISVVERHLDDAGVPHLFPYFAPAGADLNSNLATHAAALSAELAADSIAG
jgi:hypothetical protein